MWRRGEGGGEGVEERGGKGVGRMRRGREGVEERRGRGEGKV